MLTNSYFSAQGLPFKASRKLSREVHYALIRSEGKSKPGGRTKQGTCESMPSDLGDRVKELRDLIHCSKTNDCPT